MSKAVLIGAVPPLMLKEKDNPGGLLVEILDQMRANVRLDRSAFCLELSSPFYGYNRAGSRVSEGVRQWFWGQEMMASLPASYFCIKAFSETDQTEDLRAFDVPTLILHGDDDQIVLIENSAKRSVKLVRHSELKVIPGAPHGMCTTHKDVFNEALLAFISQRH